MMSEIWGIILAAGESKRIGSQKMILPYGKSTIIESVIEKVEASDIEKTVVVLGSDREKITGAIRKMNVKHCYNANYKDGMLSSVKCGIEFLPFKYRAAVFFLGDQPMIETSVINKLISAYKKSGAGILLPVYRGMRGHPLLADRKYRDEILALDKEEGLRGLLKRHPDDLIEVETDNLSVLKDIDTEEEYINELKLIS